MLPTNKQTPQSAITVQTARGKSNHSLQQLQSFSAFLLSNKQDAH